MDSELVLDLPWPADLDPASAPFKTRSETVLRRAGYHDQPQQLDMLTEAEVMTWWNAGAATAADIRFAGNRAIRRHHDETDLPSGFNTDLVAERARQTRKDDLGAAGSDVWGLCQVERADHPLQPLDRIHPSGI